VDNLLLWSGEGHGILYGKGQRKRSTGLSDRNYFMVILSPIWNATLVREYQQYRRTLCDSEAAQAAYGN
jgi:hypothetical protein